MTSSAKWVNTTLVAIVLCLHACGGTTYDSSSQPLGYGGLKPPKSLKWVAMGDSYSAGNGEYKKTSYCNRDPKIAYPFQAAELIATLGGPTTVASVEHVACSGAVINDIHTNQISAIDRIKPDIVTLTVGGNDAGFGDILLECTVNPFTYCPEVEKMPAIVGTTWSSVEDRLTALYIELRHRMGTYDANSKLYVLSYPVFFYSGVKTLPPKTFTAILGVSNGEARQINAAATRMGEVVSRAISRANARLTMDGRGDLATIRFVDWRPPVAMETVPEAVGSVLGYIILDWHNMLNAYDPNGLLADVADRTVPLAMTPPWAFLATDIPDGIDETWHPTSLGYRVAAERLTLSILSDF